MPSTSKNDDSNVPPESSVKTPKPKARNNAERGEKSKAGLYPNLKMLNEMTILSDDTSDEEQEDESMSWAEKMYRTSGKGTNEMSPEPPMIKLGDKKENKKRYNSKVVEVEDNFDAAKWWLGIKITLAELTVFIYDKNETDYTIMYAHRFDRHRRNCEKSKIQRFLHINAKQVDIFSYYFTLKGKVIAWVKMDPLMVKEIHQRAARASLNTLRTATFEPLNARARKTAIDKILMSYKKHLPCSCTASCP